MTSVYPNGIPDLLVLKDGLATFIEMKRPNGKLSEIQKVIHDKLRSKGFPVEVISSMELEKWNRIAASKEDAQPPTNLDMAKKKKAKKVAKPKSKKRSAKKSKAPVAPPVMVPDSSDAPGE